MWIRLIAIAALCVSPEGAIAQRQPAKPETPSESQLAFESRLRMAEVYFAAGEVETAERQVTTVLEEDALPDALRGRGERLLREIAEARKSDREKADRILRIRLGAARDLLEQGELSEARQIASTVLDQAKSVEVAREAAEIYRQTTPALGQQLRDRLADSSKWDWVLFCLPILVIIVALYLVRSLYWGMAWLVRRVPWRARPFVLWVLLPLVVAGCSWAAVVVLSLALSAAWALTILAAIVIVARLLYLACRYIPKPAAARPVYLGRFDDPANLGVQALVTASLCRWSREKDGRTAGLLLRDASRVPSAPAVFIPQEGHAELDLSGLPNVGGVSPGAIARLVQALPGWFRPRYPTISGSSQVRDGVLTVRLTWRPSRRILEVVSSVVSLKAAPDPVLKAADAVSYQMLYMIERECPASEAAVGNTLREGLEQLNTYVTESKAEALEAAIAIFSFLRAKLAPTAKGHLAQVHLYEGIARDLHEEHQLATTHFRRAYQLADDDLERRRAAYNEAVSQLRSLYQLDNLRNAVKTLRKHDLVRDPVDEEHAKQDPIRALSYAVKADAIAHFPIHWRKTPTELPPDATYENRLEENSRRIQKWVQQVTDITDFLDKLDTSNPDVWDETGRLQLRWSIENARGDVYLNSARCLTIPSGPSGDHDRLAQLRQEYLGKALAAFRNCEMLLPAGVETLCNLGTVLLTMGDRPKAREYFERAIKLNPAYEYAYYRIAQSWEQEKWREKVVETLTRFAKPPGIPGFHRMYRRYYVQPCSG